MNTSQQFANQFANDLCAFIAHTPTAFHASSHIKTTLFRTGFTELFEDQEWSLSKGKGYLVERNGSVISFVLGSKEDTSDGFRMIGAHTDSPCFQIKPRPKSQSDTYFKLAVEIYGGPLLNTWFDRELSIAGRIFVQLEDASYRELLIDFKKPLLNIPSLAIHFDREANTNKTVQKQKDLSPILGDLIRSTFPDFETIIVEQAQKEYKDLKIESLTSFDLFCYDAQKPSFFGLHDDYITTGRLDNLLSCFCGMQAQIDAGYENNSLLMCFNHEENGSTSTSGGNGNFLDAILTRIQSSEDRYRCLASSFLISADNAHATHPSSPEKSDGNHPILMNKGPVIKINANQRYASNARSVAIFKALCKDVEITPQHFVMNNDIPCGSTIGPMISANFGIATIDVGVASLAMHSARETTGADDPYYLYKSLHHFLKTHFHKRIK